MSLTYTDIFCGAGGSSIGLTEAGMELRLAANHWDRAIPLPDVTPRPLAWCPECAEDVAAVQTWKNPRKRKVGKYRQQYVYRCPNEKCRHALVEPYVLPAAAAIDWSDLGQRIGDRKRPLAPNTIARIRAGLAQFAQPITLEAAGNTFERRPGVRTWPAHRAPLTTLTTTATKALACPPLMLSVNHDDAHGRAYPADAAPLPPRTTKIGDALMCPPFIDVARTHNRARGVDEPLAPLTTGSNHGLVCPPFMVYGYSGGVERRVKPVEDDPLGTIVANGLGHYGLVQPPFITELRGGGSTVRPIDDPLATVTAGGGDSGGHHALTVPPGAFYCKHFTARGNPAQMSKDVRTEPLGAVTGVDHHSLVVPYYRTGKAKTTASPLDTVTARDRFALVEAAGIDVDDCLLRMLQPREHLRAQRFPDAYVVTGNKGEQTMQAGNAVSANVAHWLGRQVAKALGAAA